MKDSTGFDVSTANIFEKKISFDVLGDMVDGVKTNPRVDKPRFSLGGLKFEVNVVEIDVPEFPLAVYWRLGEDSQKHIMPGGKIETTKCVVKSVDNYDGNAGTGGEEKPIFEKRNAQDHGFLFLPSKSINRCEIHLAMKFHDIFPHRLQFVDAKVAKEAMNDCKIVLVDDEKKAVFVNKSILASRSPFFKTLFFGNFKEKHEDVIKLGEVNEEDLLEYLCCAYPPPNRPFAFKRLEALLILADRFQNDFLIASIEKFMLEKTDKTAEEKLQALKWADAFNLPALFRATLKKMNKKELQALKLTTYSGFKKENLELVVSRVVKVLSHCKE